MKSFVCILGLFILSSCVGRAQPLTIDQKAIIVKSSGKTSIVVGITMAYKKDVPRQRQAARDIHNIVGSQLVPVFSGPSPISVDLTQLLASKVPVQYLLLFQSGLDILSLYYVPIPIGQVLHDDEIKLINAFLIGILDGCNLILATTATTS